MNNQLTIVPPYNLRPWDGSILNEQELSELREKNNSEEIKKIRLKSKNSVLSNVEAVKNCIKLFDMNVASLQDADRLKLRMQKIVQSGLLSASNFSDFNFHEIRTIINCFKLDRSYPGKKLLIDHLSTKIESLTNILDSTLLLLKSKNDREAFGSMLPEDVLNEIRLLCIKIFTDISQTPVDISTKKRIII